MNKWFEKFKSVLDIKYLSDLNLRIADKLHIHIGKKETVINNNIIVVGLPQNMEALRSLLPAAIEEGYTLLGEDSAKLLEGAKQTTLIPENTSLLSFYKDKISSLDLTILKASMTIEQLYKKEERTCKDEKSYAEQVKLGLIHNYGIRGRNICRLYCAGYFSGFLKTAYEEMSKLSGFDKSHFDKFYEVVVMESPQAIFIERVMDTTKVREAIQQRIDGNKKYGIKNFNIHGIGKDNCVKIREVVSQFEKDGIITVEPEIEEKHKVITVTLRSE